MTNEDLKQYVRLVIRERKELLREDDGGGDYGGYDFGGHDDYGGGGYTSGGSGHQTVASIFVDPFIRLGKTAIGVSKIMASKALMVVQFVKQAFWNVLTPFFNSDYKDIFDKEKVRTRSVVQRYQKIFDANRDAIFTKDMWLLTFLLNPSLALGIMTMKNATPIAIHNVLGAVEVLTADYHRSSSTQNPDGSVRRGDIIGTRTNANVAKVTDYARNRVAAATGTKSYARQSRYGNLGIGEALLREFTPPQPAPTQQLTPELIAATTQKLYQSPQWQAMHKEGLGVLQGTVNDIVGRVEGIMKSQTLEQLQQATGANLSSVKQELENKISQEMKKNKGDIDDNAKAQKVLENEKILLQDAKNAYKQGRVALLNKFKEHWSQVPDAVAIYDRGIQSINNF
jgi:hypothetical protein